MLQLKKVKQGMQQGFTLLEVLLVVAIIAILAGIVIIAVNPGKQLGDSRNAQRRADVTTILNAVYQYGLDNNGNLPTAITAVEKEICGTGVLPATCTTDGLADLAVVTTSGKYVASIPKDPSCPTGCTANGVGYSILKDNTTNRITVKAPNTDGATISVTR